MPKTMEHQRCSRLLIVEDPEPQLRTLMGLMEDEGFDVIGCATASEAVEHIRREDFGVAVVDLRLPDLDGTQLVRKISDLNDQVRIIINTGYASFESAKDALNLGAFAYVEKAGDPAELIRHVHAAARWRLDRYAKELEGAVAARTAELRQANQELKKGIAQREQAEEERRELEAQLRQSQKMHAIGQLAGGVAHDFNNLLTVILGNSEVLLSVMSKDAGISEEVLRDALEQIYAAGKQAASLTRQLLTFSRRDITRPVVLDPRKIIGDMGGMLRRLIGEHIQLDINLDGQTRFIHADPWQIEQVILNFTINAADAMPEGGRLEIRVADAQLDEKHVAGHADAKTGQHVVLSVTDHGVGIAPETLEHIFEPFFTTKPVGKGTGLGLSTVYGTVKQLGGHIRVDTKLGAGTTFTAYLPVIDEEQAQEADHKPASACAGETILACEDQGMVRYILCQTLRAAGYTIIEADNGQQALEAAAQGVTIDLLITDVVMPGMSGEKLADTLAPQHPNMQVLFISGYTADHIDVRGVRNKSAQILEKPFGPTQLLRRVREVLDAARVKG